MTLRDSIIGLFRRNASKYLYVAVPSDHVQDGQTDTDALVEGRDYFRLWLAEMYLKRDRDWFKTWHPAVHSLVHFQFGFQEVDVANIAGELGLKDVDAAHLERSISLNHPMTSLMPFNGGVVEVTAALLAMQGQDFVKRFIKVMGDFAGLVAVPQLSAVLSVAAPVASGIEELLGASNGEMHLALHQTYTHKGGGANELRPAYFLAILATEAQVNPKTLWVVGDRLRQGRTMEESEPFGGYPYMLFRVQKETVRDDWEGLTSIMEPFKTAVDALGTGEQERADSFYRSAIAAAISSLDLTQADRRRVAQVLKQRFDEAKSLGLGAVETWGSIQKGIAAIPVDEALAQGEPDISEFLSKDSYGWSPSAPGSE
jgi:hypothetical protein